MTGTRGERMEKTPLLHREQALQCFEEGGGHAHWTLPLRGCSFDLAHLNSDSTLSPHRPLHQLIYYQTNPLGVRRCQQRTVAGSFERSARPLLFFAPVSPANPFGINVRGFQSLAMPLMACRRGFHFKTIRENGTGLNIALKEARVVGIPTAPSRAFNETALIVPCNFRLIAGLAKFDGISYQRIVLPRCAGGYPTGYLVELQ